MSKKHTCYFNDLVVDDCGEIRVVVHDEDLETMSNWLLAAHLRFDKQEAGVGLTGLTFGTDATPARVRAALFRFDELSRPS